MIADAAASVVLTDQRIIQEANLKETIALPSGRACRDCRWNAIRSELH
jgi:hypothetical protein